MPGRSEERAYRIEPLGKSHDRSQFSCGSEPLDRYLREQARQHAQKRIAVPFVLLEGTSNKVIGYYTLAAFGVDIGEWPEEISKKLPKYPVVPATLLGRLAVDKRHHGKGLGELLLMDALSCSCQASGQIASVAVIVDAKNEDAKAFYSHYGFMPFARRSRRLFLPMKTIEKLF